MKICFALLTVVMLAPLHAAPLITRVVSSTELPQRFDTIGGLSTYNATINPLGDVLVRFVHTNAQNHTYRWHRGVFSPFIPAHTLVPSLSEEAITSFDTIHLSNFGLITAFGTTSEESLILRDSLIPAVAPTLIANSEIDPFRTVRRPFVSDSGVVTFLGAVEIPDDPIGLDSVVVSSAPGGSAIPILKAGDPVPVAIDEDDPNKTIATIDSVALGHDGLVGCILKRNAFGNFGMILAGGNSGWSEVARLFEPAPGTEHDFRYFNSITAAAGHVAFSANTSVGTNGQTGIWRASVGSAPKLIAIATEFFGENTPGTSIAAGTLFGVQLPLLADTGACYFKAKLELSDSVTTANNDLILFHDGASLRTVIREGDPAPGLPLGEGWRIFQLPERFIINPFGRLAMIADARSTSGVTQKWLWVGNSTAELEPILKIGDAIGGKVVNELRLFSGFDSDDANPTGRTNADGKPGAFNAAGQLVIGVQHPDDRAIYILDFSKSPPTTFAPFQIGTPTAEPSTVAFPFFSKLGERYQLERSTSLTDWSPVGPPLDGEDLRVFLSDSPPSSGTSYFYRIQRKE